MNSKTRILVFSTLLFIFFLFVLAASVYKVRFDSLPKFSQYAFATKVSTSQSSTDSTPDDIRVLIGILTLPDKYQHRHFLRTIYGTQLPKGAQVDIKFVLCNLTNEDQKVLIALEIMSYDDIIILNCTENMDKGKTYTYFSSLPEIFNDNIMSYPPYHYVMKGDDDVYIRLENLAESLKPLPREDLYYGYVVPCLTMDPYVGDTYMAGMGYMVSWDIVEWIRDSEIPKKHLEGPEDKVFGDWIRDGHKGKNRYNGKWSMYDYPIPRTECSHEFWPNTVAVHKLKNQDQWIKTLNYFNVTNNLKPSKLYHIA